MTGLKIKTVTGMEFDVNGIVEYDSKEGIYYCDGQSWPEEIVTHRILDPNESDRQTMYA